MYKIKSYTLNLNFFNDFILNFVLYKVF